MDEPLVSIFIRVRDEEVALRHVLENLKEQVIDGLAEIVVLDNESVDSSAQVALELGARVFTFPRELFGYGRALNLGVHLCRGQIIVNLSAHSVPQAQDWLSELVKPIRADPAIGAAFCRQIPPSRVSRLELRRFACFPASDIVVARQQFVAICDEGLDPYATALFSNSACAIRRDVVASHPFRDLLYAEDRAFVVDYLMAGGAVAYVHDAVVSYQRNMTWKSAYRVGYRAQVSKRLVRELAATYTGSRFRCGKDTVDRLVRAVLVLPGLLVRLAMSAFESRGLRRRSVIHALRSTGATLGLAKGAVQWRRHIATLSSDTRQLEEALRQCVLLSGEEAGRGSSC